MSLDVPNIELSPTAGRNGDGVVVGAINQSQLLAAVAAVTQATITKVLKRNRDGSEAFADVTALANGNTTDAFQPFGTDAEFSANDEFWIAANKPICGLYFQITTPGVWTGTGLSVLESTDGKTLTPVANLVEPSNGFRNAAGWYGIEFDGNVANRKAISPIFGETESKYIVIRPNGLTAKTTAPKFSGMRAICVESDVTYASILSALSGDMTDSNFASTHQVFPVVGDAIYFCSPDKLIGYDDAVFQASGASRDGVYEYYSDSGAWKPLTITDPGNKLRNGPATFQTTPEYFSARFTLPNDWTVRALTLGEIAATGCWWRFRVTAVSPLGLANRATYRRRVRAYGSGRATGLHHAGTRDYTCLCWSSAAIPAATDVKLTLANNITGDSRTVTIPSGSREGFATFSALTISAGQMLIISHVGGGSVTGITLHVM